MRSHCSQTGGPGSDPPCSGALLRPPDTQRLPEAGPPLGLFSKLGPGSITPSALGPVSGRQKNSCEDSEHSGTPSLETAATVWLKFSDLRDWFSVGSEGTMNTGEGYDSPGTSGQPKQSPLSRLQSSPTRMEAPSPSGTDTAPLARAGFATLTVHAHTLL